MSPATKARLEQAGYVGLAIAAQVLPKLVVVEPTWTWVPQAVTLVALLAAAFRPDPKSAATIAELSGKVESLTGRISSLIAPDISSKGRAP